MKTEIDLVHVFGYLCYLQNAEESKMQETNFTPNNFQYFQTAIVAS